MKLYTKLPPPGRLVRIARWLNSRREGIGLCLVLLSLAGEFGLIAFAIWNDLDRLPEIYR